VKRQKYDLSNAPPPVVRGRNNPQSLTHTLWAIRTQLNKKGDSRREFSEKISKIGLRFSQKGITENLIAKIETDETRIFYWHLEAYARYLGENNFPSAIILLISRINAELKKSIEKETDLTDLRNMLNRTKDLVDFFLDNEVLFRRHSVSGHLTGRKLRALFDVYRSGSPRQVDMVDEFDPKGRARERIIEEQMSFGFASEQNNDDR
jgi:hypothetical protein